MENLSKQSVLAVAEIELVYKSMVKPSQRSQLRSTPEMYEMLLANWDLNKIEFIEQFKVIFLSRSLRVLGMYEMSTGGTAGTVVDIKLLFISALKINAHFIVVSHNHPSGNFTPSNADKKLTQKIKQAGCILDIHLLDHIIITQEGYFSFTDEGML
jgi:DNA repair protein RadC